MIPIPNWFTAHPHLFLFIGLILGGETVLLPAVFLALHAPETIHTGLALLFILSFAATLVSDTSWYIIGRFISLERITQIPIARRNEQKVRQLSAVFRTNALGVLFLSKFVYGTRIAAQLLCGIHRIPFSRYMAVDLAGIAALNSFYAVIALLVRANLSQYQHTVKTILVGLSIYIIVAALLQFGVHRLIKRVWFRQ